MPEPAASPIARSGADRRRPASASFPSVPRPAAVLLHLGTLQLGAPRVESDTINIADAVGPVAAGSDGQAPAQGGRAGPPSHRGASRPYPLPGPLHRQRRAPRQARAPASPHALLRARRRSGATHRHRRHREAAARRGEALSQDEGARKDIADTDTTPSSRHIPAAVRRLVYERAGGRCAYRDRYGRRCSQRHDLEFHHRHPFAHGGDHSPANLTLMCRTHNTLVAEQDYGEDVMARFRAATNRTSVPVEVCGARITVQPQSRALGIAAVAPSGWP